MEAKLDQMRDMLEDEAEHAMPPSERQPPNIRVPVNTEPDLLEDLGASSPSFKAGGCVEAIFLEALREQLPHLSNFPDEGREEQQQVPDIEFQGRKEQKLGHYMKIQGWEEQQQVPNIEFQGRKEQKLGHYLKIQRREEQQQVPDIESLGHKEQ